MSGEEPPPLPGRLIAVAYLLAALCALAPFAFVGALFAGVTIARRGAPAHGAAVVALGAAGVVLFVLLIR